MISWFPLRTLRLCVKCFQDLSQRRRVRREEEGRDCGFPHTIPHFLLDVAEIVAGGVGLVFGELLGKPEVRRAMESGNEPVDDGFGDRKGAKKN